MTRHHRTTGVPLLTTLLTNRALSLALIIVLICLVMSLVYPKSFFSFYNFSSVLLQMTVEGTLAVGMMFLIVAGVFDLSIGSSLAASAAVTAIVAKLAPALPLPLACLAGILTSVMAGLANGAMVTLGVDALIATLAMMGILRGAALLLLGTTLGLPDAMFPLGQAMVLGIQIPVYYMIVIALVGAFLLRKGSFFRRLYFIGDNRRAAELSGINVRRSLVLTFAIMGAIAGFTGVVLGARLGAAVAALGQGEEMRVIAAVIIGGASLTGGAGTVMGAIMGALFMVLLQNIMVIVAVNPYLQDIIIGVVLILAVTLDVLLRRRMGRA